MISSLVTSVDVRTEATRLPRDAGEAYGVWKNVVRLDNRDAQLIVAPACGRVVRYGPSARFDDAENFLWENPENSPRAVPVRRSARHDTRHDARPVARKFDGTIGGEFGLPWPQSRWPEMFDPSASASHDAQLLSFRTIAMETELSQAFGFKLRREVSLAPHGERVHIQSSLIPLESTGRKRRAPAMPVWAPWSISHIVRPTRIGVRINPSNDLPGGHKTIGSQSWESIRQIGDDILLARCPEHPAKFGCDGDLVVAEIGYHLLIQRRVDDELSPGRDLPGEAVQISATGDHATIEFTGQRGLASPKLHVMWDFMSWNPTNTDSEFAALVRSL